MITGTGKLLAAVIIILISTTACAGDTDFRIGILAHNKGPIASQSEDGFDVNLAYHSLLSKTPSAGMASRAVGTWALFSTLREIPVTCIPDCSVGTILANQIGFSSSAAALLYTTAILTIILMTGGGWVPRFCSGPNWDLATK